jgi:hypothetical protein
MAPQPLVFVPGLPGTKLLDKASGEELFPNLAALLSAAMRPKLLAELSGPDDPDQDGGVVPGEPIRWVIELLRGSFIDFSGTLKQAASLYDILEALGYGPFDGASFGDRFRPVGWDWRRPVDQRDTLARVRAAIVELHDALGEPVTVLCHSTGGLVVRSLLEGEPALAERLERVIAIGIPWIGTLAPLPMLAGGSGWGPFTAAETQRAIGHSWAAFDLLPPDPAKTDLAGADFFLDAAGHPASPLTATGWIPADPGFDPLRARAARSDAHLGERARQFDLGGRQLAVVNVVGRGASTITHASLDAQGQLHFDRTPEGDGTVPRRSAAWLKGDGVSTFLVPIGNYTDDQIRREHIVLWENRPVRDLLAALLAGRARLPYAYAAVDGDDAVAAEKPAVRVYLVALDEKGGPLPGAYATALQVSPPDPTRYGTNDEGLGQMTLQRENISQGMHDTFHFQVQFHWQEAGAERTSPPQTLWIKKPG